MLNAILDWIHGLRRVVRLCAGIDIATRILPLLISKQNIPIDIYHPNMTFIAWYVLIFVDFELLMTYIIDTLRQMQVRQIQASEQVFTPKDITIRGIPALTEDNELSTLIEQLVSCCIAADTYREPVIASDLYLYDNIDGSYKSLINRALINQEKPLSSYTREPLLSSPFPFAYNQMKTLCDEVADNTKTIDDVIKKLADLAICPVTKKIMSDPKFAYLIHTDSKGTKQHFVLACDQKALDMMLPSNFELIKKRDFSELKVVIEYIIAEKSMFDATFKVLPEYIGNTSDSDLWTTAFETCKNKFPSTPRTPTSVGRNLYAIFTRPIGAGLDANNEEIRDNHRNAGPR